MHRVVSEKPEKISNIFLNVEFIKRAETVLNN